MHFLTKKWCVLAATVVLLTSAKGLKRHCTPDAFKCVIEGWNPSVDGHSLFQQVPNVTKSIHLVNLQSLLFSSKHCNTTSRYADSLVIYDSPQLQMVQISATCNVRVVIVQNTEMFVISFDPNDSLTSVVVKNSPLTVVPVTLQTLPNIESITLENTNIELVEVSFFYSFQHLKEISIAHGKLQAIGGTSATFHWCPLDSLHLDHNSLRVVNLNVFVHFTSLTVLNLAYNRIEVLSGRISNPILASLLLNNNRLKVIDMCPWNVLHHLNALTIASNNVERMPLCMNRLRNLTHVSMQFNQISSIEVEQLIQLPNLVSINLSFNNISSIPISRGSYPPKLIQLDLCGNPINNNTIPDSMIGSIDVLF